MQTRRVTPFSSCRSTALAAALSLGLCFGCGRPRPDAVDVESGDPSLSLSSGAPDEPPDTGGEEAIDEPAPLEALPSLRTGTRTPIDAGTLAAQVVARDDATEGHAHLELSLAVPPGEHDVSWTHAVLDPPAAGSLVALETRLGGAELRVHVRRPASATGAARGVVFGERFTSGRARTVRARWSAEANAGAVDAQTGDRWRAAMIRQLRDGAHPWDQFAAGRLEYAGGGQPSAAPGFDRPRRTDLRELMDTTTGWLSMQEALQHDRGLRVRARAGEATVPLVEVTGPPLDAHPFPAMAQQLGHDPATIDVMKLEPLARAAPSDFWYARVDDIRLMLRLMDEADAWITPVAQILQQNPEDRRLSQRYQEQLGLRRSGLAKALGHTVVGAIAIVGSDPYLREGSDVTMIFTVKQRAVLEAELGRHLEAYRAEVPGIAASVELYEGVELRVAKDPAGRVRQHRASFSDASGDLELVSNSPAALRRVLDALAGRSPQLAGEDDLKYMLVRDQGVHEVFAFLSDKFIAAVVGPRQKILAARRQLALSELLVPGYAALLHGWLYGQAPATSEALVASRLLAEDELRHDDGDPITFTPGAGARSKWGRPAALTPLIDMPTPALVTVDERDAYDRFTQTYQTYWKRFIDPVAVRLDITEVAGRESARVDVRVLPLISATDYSDIAERVGDTRIDVPPLSPQFGGLTAIWAVGADARLRGDLNRLLRGATGQSKLGIDWLGAWVMAGVADRAAGVELLSYVDETVQLRAPERKDNFFDDLEVWKLAGKFPVFLAADVKNPAALVATLAAVRAMLGEVAPGVVDWGEHSQHRELPIVRIGMNPKTPMLINREQAEAVAIYYAQTGSAIVLALDPEVLKTVIDRLLDGEAPTHKEGAREGGQFVIDVRSDPGRPLWTAALWAVQGQADDAQRTARRSAEILLRGQPSVAGDPSALAALGLAYFGSAPLTAHGGHDFKLSPDGVGDPVQGTREQPIFGDLPYPGSPVETLMRRFSGLRGEVSFDAEPTAAGHDARSLHTTFTLRLGKGE